MPSNSSPASPLADAARPALGLGLLWCGPRRLVLAQPKNGAAAKYSAGFNKIGHRSANDLCTAGSNRAVQIVVDALKGTSTAPRRFRRIDVAAHFPYYLRKSVWLPVS